MTDTTHSARRQRHGQRPTEKLVFEDAAATIVQEVRELFSAAGFEVREGAGFCELVGSIDAGGVLVETLTQAAANKAAEEGGLPVLPGANLLGWNAATSIVMGYTQDDMQQYARQAITADRASRQVANKAIEIDLNDLLRLSMRANDAAKSTIYAGEDFVAVCDVKRFMSEQVANKADVEQACVCGSPATLGSVHRIDGPCYVAEVTPPATTGASTAELKRDAERHRYTRATTTAVRDPESGERIEVTPEMYDTAIDRAIADDPDFSKGIKSRHLVGASTVLTDERIGQLYEEATSYTLEDDDYAGVRALVRLVEREVAAQAGQVAVPDWTSVDERLPDGCYCLATYRDRAGKLRIIRAMYVRQFEIEANGDECDSETDEANDREYLKAGWYELIDNWGEYSSVYVCEGPVTHWMALPALPGAQASTSGERQAGGAA